MKPKTLIQKLASRLDWLANVKITNLYKISLDKYAKSLSYSGLPPSPMLNVHNTNLCIIKALAILYRYIVFIINLSIGDGLHIFLLLISNDEA